MGVEIVKAAAPCQAIYATHMRDESAGLLDGIREAIEIGERAGRRIRVMDGRIASDTRKG